MKKQEFDKKALKIAVDRLSREIRLKNTIAPHWYLVGYHMAICDFACDYAGVYPENLDWDTYMDELEMQGKVKRGVISLKDIKVVKGGDGL